MEELSVFIIGMVIIGVYSLYWMINMLKYVRKLRIMQSMQLQVLQQIAKEQGINIDLEKISKEVEKVA